MRVDEQLYVADVLEKNCERLEMIRADLASELGPLPAQLIDAIAGRLSDVEATLRTDGEKRERKALRGRVRRFRTRLRSFVSPRIGTLRQHPPRALTVPTKYLLTDAPRPAPTISIVTPCFQHGRFLERTLYSVVSQSYPALEYIVQDGGSSDETADVLGRFDHLLAGWISEPDAGQADAINRGFKRTSGEIMAYLNSDDLLLPGSLAYVARYFVDHPDVDAVYGHRILIDENDKKIGSWMLPRHDDRALTLADYVPQETLFWRRAVWEKAGGSLDPSFAYALDWDLLLRLRDAGATMVRLPRFLGAFRIHDEQKSTAAWAIGLAECSRLRKRVHGRDMPIDEVLARLRSYLRRHLVAELWRRAAAQLPRPQTVVRVVPFEPWLRAPQADAAQPQKSGGRKTGPPSAERGGNGEADTIEPRDVISLASGGAAEVGE